ncbi:GyrI-like domain-containing protein [Fibrella aquatica]|jgi:predicted transcriptional regulator YdeE|uniref:GyrI-like domain-containing protein n=1 Tax=Fibrella aquatica TaxID=3242487 RepID=UPI0035211B2F
MTTTLKMPANALTISHKTAFAALTTQLRTTLDTLGELAIPADRQLREEAQRLGLDPTVPTHWIYTNFSGHADDEFDLEIALPVDVPTTTSPNPGAMRDVPAFRCAEYTHLGPWSELSAVYDTLFQQFYAEDHLYNGCVREIYRVVDWENQASCITDIQIGIA